MPAFKFTIPRGENYFPGTFFGFAPQPPEGFDFSASSTEPVENDDIMDFEETASPEVSESIPSPMEEIVSDDSGNLPEAPPAEPSTPAPVKKKRRRRRYNKKKSPAAASDASVSSDSANNSESE